VASSDAHNVKPWFAGRVDFAPDVKDLTVEGFPLLGGRLDYVGERRVGALVYQRRLHIVNVFMWPAPSLDDVAPKLTTKNGYNLLAWSKSGITYWAISDLDALERWCRWCGGNSSDGDFSGEVQCTASGGEVNWLSELPIERAPAVDLSQRDLT
jgi:hypothetical protein